MPAQRVKKTRPGKRDAKNLRLAGSRIKSTQVHCAQGECEDETRKTSPLRAPGQLVSKCEDGTELLNSPGESARVESIGDEVNGQSLDHTGDTTRNRPGPKSNQLTDAAHLNSSGETLHLKTSSPQAEALVCKAISFLTETWKPELIPPVFAMRSYIKKNSADGSATSSVQVVLSDSLLPIASFVEEMLAQSRTSGAVLMAAMSYLETLRPQIPDLQTSYARSASSSELSGSPYSLDPSKLENPDDLRSLNLAISLPSPLLCPRRMFLAALVLAWKFLEDGCLRNKHWAIQTGLPVWEVSRCERALGHALEWRLWPDPCIYRGAVPNKG